MSDAWIATVTLKTTEPREVARFWRALLGYTVAPNHTDSVMLVGDGPTLLIQPSARRVESSAVHLDLRPRDQGECVARALALGATRADIAQLGAEPWVVLADPGGTLFCVLQSAVDAERLHAAQPGTPTEID